MNLLRKGQHLYAVMTWSIATILETLLRILCLLTSKKKNKNPGGLNPELSYAVMLILKLVLQRFSHPPSCWLSLSHTVHGTCSTQGSINDPVFQFSDHLQPPLKVPLPRSAGLWFLLKYFPMLLKESGRNAGEQSLTGFREMAQLKDTNLGLDPGINTTNASPKAALIRKHWLHIRKHIFLIRKHWFHSKDLMT